MYWTADKNSFKQEADYLGKAIVVGLVIFGLLIGTSVGFYIAVRVIPLPSITNNLVTAP